MCHPVIFLSCKLTPECDDLSLAAGLALFWASEEAEDLLRFSLEAKQPESRGKERRRKALPDTAEMSIIFIHSHYSRIVVAVH